MKAQGLLIALSVLVALGLLSCARGPGREAVVTERSDELVLTGRFIIASTGQPYWVDVGGRNDPDPSSDWPVHANAILESGEVHNLKIDQPRRDGRFWVRQVPSFARTLEFHSNHTLKTYVSFHPANASIERETDLGDVLLDYGQSIHVEVFGPNGEAVNSAFLRLTTKGDDPIDRADTTNERGEYMFRGFPCGPAVLTAAAYRDRGNNWVAGAGGIDLVTQEITIEKSPVTEVDVKFSK